MTNAHIAAHFEGESTAVCCSCDEKRGGIAESMAARLEPETRWTAVLVAQKGVVV